jgi:hypothetical protein
MKWQEPGEGPLLEIESGTPAELGLWKLRVSREEGALVLSVASAEQRGRRRLKWQTLSRAEWQPEAGWHRFTAAWKRKTFVLSVDGDQLIGTELPAAVPIRRAQHGRQELRARLNPHRVHPARVSFGPISGAVLDDVSMESSPTSSGR